MIFKDIYHAIVYIAVPAIMLLYWLAAPLSRRRRAFDIALASATIAVVSLSWAIAVSLAPGHHPFPAGSTDGTVWNAMFVFNGLGRANGNVGVAFVASPGPFRLLGGGAGHLGELIGCVLVASVTLAAASAPQWMATRPGRRESGPC